MRWIVALVVAVALWGGSAKAAVYQLAEHGTAQVIGPGGTSGSTISAFLTFATFEAELPPWDGNLDHGDTASAGGSFGPISVSASKSNNPLFHCSLCGYAMGDLIVGTTYDFTVSAYSASAIGPVSATLLLYLPDGYGLENITGVAAVPEPSTWALMMLGFVGIAGLAYRKRAKTA